MSTRVPRAWETSWAQDAIRAEKDRPSGQFRYPGHDQCKTGEVVYLVDRYGLCEAVDAGLVRTERWRVERVNSAGAPPAGCGSAIISAPARPDLSPFHDVRVVPVGSDGFEVVTERYPGGAPGRVRDVFDKMNNQARRRSGRPFDFAQVHYGRLYRYLHERVQSAGVKCSSTFDAGPRGAGNRDFMDIYAADAERLRSLQSAIGTGIAKATRYKQAALADGVRVGDVELRKIGRRLITARTLVDAVCLAEQSLSDVLTAHGWRATGKNRMALRAALCAALDRMQGL